MEPYKINIQEDTIAAISTPPGMGGIAVIRVSGDNAVNIVNDAWKGTDLKNVNSHTVHLGKYFSIDGEMIDEGLVTVFKSPASYTGENSVEISIHGSTYIQNALLSDLIKRGVRIAEPGEFTKRAFLNGKIDLAQAEGVADLIASASKASHDMAINQTRGNFSKEFDSLRDKLINLASLLELELDFSEEDVEFANRKELRQLCKEVSDKIKKLTSSYAHGSVMKNGVPVVISGIPNAGKSSLLNLLLNDDKAIVTDIPGTTRDTIEDIQEIDGVLYRFIDTAGIRETDDPIEEIGVERALSALNKAYLVIWLLDLTQPLKSQLLPLQRFLESHPSIPIIPLLSKADILSGNPTELLSSFQNQNIFLSKKEEPFTNSKSDVSSETKLNYKNPQKNEFPDVLSSSISFSSKTNQGLEELIVRLKETVTAGLDTRSDIIVTNARHFQNLSKADESLSRAMQSLDSGLSSDLVAQDIRETISHLSLITGTISNDTLLHSIFSRFCIGK